MSHKILVVSNAYPSASHPSYGVFVHRCVQALQNVGCDVRVVGLSQQPSLAHKAWAYLGFWLRINTSLLHGNYHCVYIHYPLHTLLACLPALWLRKHRLLLNFHGHDLVPITGRGYWLKWLVSPLLRGPAKVLVPSSHFKRLFDDQHSQRAGGSAIVFRSGGVAPAYLHGPIAAIASRPRSCLFLSRWVQSKGWPAYLALAHALLQRDAGFRFTLAGAGPDEQAIRMEISKRELQHAVVLTQACTEAENLQLYRSHRYFVFPSLLDESLGLANLEAMACGCVVLSSDFKAVNDYLSHGQSGLVLAASGFPEAACQAIVDLEADPWRTQMIANNAQAKAHTFSQKRASRHLADVLEIS